jgi:hypothetical protein
MPGDVLTQRPTEEALVGAAAALTISKDRNSGLEANENQNYIGNNIGVLDTADAENKSPTKVLVQAAPQASAGVRPALEPLERQETAVAGPSIGAAPTASTTPAPRRVQFNLFGRVDVAGILTEVSEKQRILSEAVPAVISKQYWLRLQILIDILYRRALRILTPYLHNLPFPFQFQQ